MEKTDETVVRACDLFRESEYELRVSKFLTPKEQLLVRDGLRSMAGKNSARCFFWGGCVGTERCAAVFLPEWLYDSIPAFAEVAEFSVPAEDRQKAFAEILLEDSELRAEIPITPLKIVGSGFRTLGHRDFMGSILALGIERNMIGDIVVCSESEALVFAQTGIVPYLQTELKKTGRDGVRVETTKLLPTETVERAYEALVIHVSSMRLDGIVNQLTGEGRSTAAEMIQKGLVEHNYFPTDNGAAQVKPGDILSVRGVGKFVVGEADGTTRSGRLRLHCKKYV